MNKEAVKPSDPSEDELILRWFDWPAMLILAVLMVVVFAQFVTRYVLNDSWAWTEEVSRYLLMGLVFSGCVSVVARSEHIRLEVVRQRVSVANRAVMARFSSLVSTAYYMFLAIALLVLATQTSQNLVSVSFPKALVYAGIAIFLVAVCVIKLCQLVRGGSHD